MQKLTPEKWLEYFLGLHPELVKVERQVRQVVKNTKKAIWSYQAAALYHYAKPYNGGKILEIGTAYGYSAFYLASACPDSQITTLNASKGEIAAVEEAGVFSRFNGRVTNLHYKSWDYFQLGDGTADLSFVFIDGDHRPRPIKQDIQFFNRLLDGGMLFFHDYSPLGSRRHCPPVYEAVNDLAEYFGREPDALVIDDGNVGMAGFMRYPGECV